MGLVACTRCTRVWPAGTRCCARCGQRLYPRVPQSLQRVWAWWSLGLIAYVPANIYPMLETRTLVSTQDNTIVGGAVEIARHGSWGIAAVILTASVLIPIGKFLAVAGLALSVAHGSHVSRARRQQLYEVVEYIGRWSMIDVFVVAILSALVQLGAVVSISPGPASLFFAVSVIATMLSAQSFDSRLLWDGPDPSPASRSRLA
ncbi:paraquat-inducible membrane protein A [Rhodovulum sulfidophilum]|uniref:Paraquat-inducible protein A n=1 Tax=Rhodovulum visakhapatnamense TaxID=364297 RepID=A0ABS1RE79_9RHOB|nr:paraquat-inducible protein A [Rhodovulum visakhapatnamense]MBL3568031.1 paraquat-inducible protein A [Rhodovulum visakhapatnamense]MBL3577946.1 paraquat-inducible protein A [Rhodovulum visakhapatnamense]OLS46806.1 paraquat-inducible membrane protein A [Rhodovulum sulfidophilum]